MGTFYNMKFNYKFFSYTFCLICCAVQPDVFAAKNNNCLTGGIYEQCGFCKQCPANCYCPPVSKGAVDCTGWTAIYCRSDYGIKSNTNAAISNGRFGIKLCPAAYPYSDKGTTSENGCYDTCKAGTVFAGKNLYNTAISCGGGTYRPKGTNACSACPDDGKSICPGTSAFKPLCAGAASDEGIKKCDDGMVPNSGKTACVKEEPKKYNCGYGEYLPANSTSCAPCPEGAKCEGGEWEMRTIDQGIKKKNTVPAGYYLPAGTSEPKACETSKNYYCPGGDYMESNQTQGMFECPKQASRANKQKTACVMSLGMEKLRACWKESEDPERFRSCVLAGKHYQ